MFRLDVTPEGAQSLADELSRAAEAGLFHPSIVEPIAAGVEGTVAYRAEEYVAAETLDVAMRHVAPSPLATALPIITQLAGAVDFARAAGVGHGALHPRDVFVTPEETRATGFGVVDALERVGIRAPVRRPYSAPERIEGKSWGTPADVFAIGAIAYELLSGKRPSGTGTEIGPLPGSLGGAQQGVLSVLTKAMDPDPSRRFSTALAFASALESAAHGEPLTVAAAGIAATDAISDTVVEAPGDDEDQDDIASERDDDVAHHDLVLREQESEREPSALASPKGRARGAGGGTPAQATKRGPATIEDEATLLASDQGVGGGEDPEAEADRMILGAAAVASDEPSARFKEDFAPQETPPRSVASGRAAVSSEPEYSYAPAIVPERRSRALPMAAMLALGLLVGFAVGYGVGARDPGETDVRAGAPQTETSAAPQPSGGAYSEQAVARPSETAAQPAAPAAGATTPPPVPTEAPTDGAEAASRSRTSGRLVVDSIPARAGVMVNGRWRGRTPLNLDQLPFGKHTLRVVQPGYAPSNQSFMLSANDPIEVLSVRLQRQDGARAPQPAPRSSTPAARAPTASTRPNATASRSQSFTGSIYVDSRPRGARVLIDGRPVGTTPLSVPELRIGAHVIRLELADHRPWSSSARVAAGEVVRVTGSLERIQ